MLNIIRRLNRREVLFIMLCLVFTCFQVWLELQLPDFMSGITRSILGGILKSAEIGVYSIKMAGCAFGGMIMRILIGYLSCKVAVSFSQRLRASIFEKIESFSADDINRYSTSGLITRVTNDVDRVHMAFSQIMSVAFQAPLLVAFGFYFIVGKNEIWTEFTGGAILIIIISFILISLYIIPKSKKLQMLTDETNRIVRESLNGFSIVRAYNEEKYQEKKFGKINDKLTETNFKMNIIMQCREPGMLFVMNMLSLAIYWSGAYIINQSDPIIKNTVFSEMIVFTSYASIIIMGFLLIAIIVTLMPSCIISAKRISEILTWRSSIREGKDDFCTSDKGSIEFSDVSFCFRESHINVLKKINFKVSQGETLGIIGSTGSGKSTVLKLIMRFFDVTSGRILVNGVDIRKYRFKTLYDKFGYISQSAMLLSGTLEDNICCGGKTCNKEHMSQAAKAASIDSFIEKSEESYSMRVEQNGKNFSGGQKQRICLARAIYHSPEIFLFDDSFSALDYVTERAIKNKLHADYPSVTKIIVSQRINTIMDADRILVLANGAAMGYGTHSELLDICDVYREIVMSQLNGGQAQ